MRNWHAVSQPARLDGDCHGLALSCPCRECASPAVWLYPCAELTNAQAKLDELLSLYYQNYAVLGPEQTCLVVGLGGGDPNCPTSYSSELRGLSTGAE